MCGIWCLFGVVCSDRFISEFKKIQHRGPDAWRIEVDRRLKNACIGFHRLSVVDDLNGMQPMKIHRFPNLTVLCNGELYNCKTLKAQYGFEYETLSDTECVFHLYTMFGFEETVKNLDGVYSMCLIDLEKKKLFLARDPYGVRPQFRAYSRDNKILAVSSEAKAISALGIIINEVKQLEQLKPGTFEEYRFNEDGSVSFVKSVRYFSMDEDIIYWKYVPQNRG